MSKEEEKQGKKSVSFLLFGFRIEAQVEVEVEVGTSTDTATDEIEKKRKRDGGSVADGSRRKKAKADDINSPEGAIPSEHAGGLEGALREMGATESTFVCIKVLTPSDTDPRQNRLLLPKPCVRERFLGLLTEAEKMRVMGGERITTVMLDAEGRRWTTFFNSWKSCSYNLNGDWIKLVQASCLSAREHCVEIRAFRHGHSEQRGLGFVVLHRLKQSASTDREIFFEIIKKCIHLQK